MVKGMTADSLFSWLATGIPLIGAVASLVFWEDLRRLKGSCLLWCALSLAPVAGINAIMPEGPLPLYLLPVSAAISLLGQPAHKSHRFAWLMSLIYLGLGLGVISHPAPVSHVFLLALLVTTAGLLLGHRTMLWPVSWWGISLFGLAGLGAILSVFANPAFSSSAALLTCTVLLPLAPFHTGYVTALTRLPGNLPSFAAILLPSVGLHMMASVISTASILAASTLGFLGLAGALYGAIKALAQTRVRLMLAYGSLSFFCMLWWFVATSHAVTLHVTILIASLGLATCGLLIAWQVIRTRYGDDVDPLSISGLASSMPTYAVLVSLLALAAMGLPPFGVFAGFTGLLLSSPIPSLLGLLIVLAAWLAASWYILNAVQSFLFGTERSDLRYHDVVHSESIALLLTILALVVLGLTPSDWFGSNANSAAVDTPSQGLTWLH